MGYKSHLPPITLFIPNQKKKTRLCKSIMGFQEKPTSRPKPISPLTQSHYLFVSINESSHMLLAIINVKTVRSYILTSNFTPLNSRIYTQLYIQTKHSCCTSFNHGGEAIDRRCWRHCCYGAPLANNCNWIPRENHQVIH